MDITKVDLAGLQKANRTKNVETSGEFGSFLNDAVRKVNDLELKADDLTNRFASGEDIDIHNVMIAAEQANIAMQLTVQIQNKLVEAYNELMRMQI
ncbi:flagellar hook-basal body complex protein FliE [Proteinivorax hydrogeniformans]|uniref:Flagellar hook-basal body complex protein FliE n=1 Tax=Proteinivorax hydrogeniformans TaxID=1826727 RepID=A0AAU8HP44_9FIRM